jgi:hypothetical protein
MTKPLTLAQRLRDHWKNGVGSYYCHDCYMRVQALAASGEAGR